MPKILFSEEVCNEICQNVRLGMTQARAAAAAGVSESALYDWLNKAIEEPEKYPDHVEFYENLQKANADCEKTLAEVMQRNALLDWKAALEVLRARFPKEWGKQTVVITDWEKKIQELGLDPEEIMDVVVKVVGDRITQRRDQLESGDAAGSEQVPAEGQEDLDPAPWNAGKGVRG